MSGAGNGRSQGYQVVFLPTETGRIGCQCPPLTQAQGIHRHAFGVPGGGYHQHAVLPRQQPQPPQRWESCLPMRRAWGP